MKRLGAYYVYIVECADGTFYTGLTNDLEGRLKKHNAGTGAKYVRGRGPVRLVYSKKYGSLSHTLKAEIRIKTLKRAQKLEMIKARDQTKPKGVKPK